MSLKSLVKFLLRNTSHKIVTFCGKEMRDHDRIHLLVAEMSPIRIAGHMLDGIG